MEEENNPAYDVVTQLSIGGFDEDTRAKDLVKYLEEKIGLVWRCRLKKSWTPEESYPVFDVTDIPEKAINNAYRKVVPHAFVHFVKSSSRDRAIEAAKESAVYLNSKQLKVSLGPENPFTLNQRRRKTIPLKIPDVGMEIGSMVNRNSFFVCWRESSSNVEFIVDPFDGTCKFCFTKNVPFAFKGITAFDVIKCDFKLEFLVRDITEMNTYSGNYCLVVLLHLAYAPRVWYRTADDDVEVTVPFDLLDDDDPWIRTTDFTPSGALSRCDYYRVSIPPRHRGKLEKAVQYLSMQSVRMGNLRNLRVLEERDFGRARNDPFFSIQSVDGLPFDVLFMLNVVLHKGIINQHQLSEDIYTMLKTHSSDVTLAALKDFSSCKKPVLDPERYLKFVFRTLLKNPLQSSKPAQNFTQIRRVVITPTRVYCYPPETELSNRVLRNYMDISDRFIRVTFMDEGIQTMNSNVLSYYVPPIVKDIDSNLSSQKTGIFKRVKEILCQGFVLCGRKYSFLAFSPNQLRDRAAWFFEEDNTTNVAKIKSWMGKFTDKNIAKYAARIGLCFSSTHATVTVAHSQVQFDYPDVERNGYTFSDGVGMISPKLSKEVAEMLQLTALQPCAYQIRFAGCKGVVATWPSSVNPKELTLRRSMKKFISTHTTLEICQWTRFQPGFLNRQIIILLSALKVPDENLWNMQEAMLSNLDSMLVNPDIAYDVLVKSCAENGNSPAIMLGGGFRPSSEPHLRGMLNTIRAAQLRDLRDKSRIFVDKGRWLMGCLDELGVLEEGQCFIRVSGSCIEECFGAKKEFTVVEGVVAIAKNPCLHPGDIRILKAVDAPDLHHMYDCLVFPQKGYRPPADEASGSDLDGDLYFVTWDESLLPPDGRSHTPMEYEKHESKSQSRPVQHQDIIEFFAKNMVNEDLGTICNAHVVLSDLREKGALDEDCMHLAKLAATAVDFPKTGKIARMPPELKPKLYPDFMGKDDHQSYMSVKIIGRLYRKVINSHGDFPDLEEMDVVYDKDLEMDCPEELLVRAWETKCSYDRQMMGLMGQYRIQREEEIVSGHVWSMPRYPSRKLGVLKEKLKHSYSAIRKKYRNIFEEEACVNEDKSGALERKASAWYQVTYHPMWLKKTEQRFAGNNDDFKIMLSFPWIASDYIARIKVRIRCTDSQPLDFSKPINFLVNYLNHAA